MPRPDDAARAQMLKQMIAQKMSGGAMDEPLDAPQDAGGPPPLPQDGGPTVPPPPQGGPPMDPEMGGMPPMPPDAGGGMPPQGEMVQVPRELLNKFMEQSGMDTVPIPKQLVDSVMQQMMQAGSRNATAQSMGSDGAPPMMAPSRMPPRDTP